MYGVKFFTLQFMDFYEFHYIFMWPILCNEQIGEYINDFLRKYIQNKNLLKCWNIFSIYFQPIFTCPNVMKQILLRTFLCEKGLEFF
jgi:hypothetical protein